MNDIQRAKSKLIAELSKFTIQNEYFEKMLKLIEENDSAPRAKIPERELHHICPKFYWKKIGQPVCNEDWNLVSLTKPDHLLCHYYLYKCVLDGYKGKASAPINFLKRYIGKSLVLDDSTIEELCEIANTRYGASFNTHWYHKVDEDGSVTEVMAKKCPKGFTEGRSPEIGKSISIHSLGKPGHVQSEETRRKISEANRGRTVTAEHVENLRKTLEDEGFCTDAIEFYMEEFFPFVNLPPQGAILILDLIGQCLENPETINPLIELLGAIQNGFDHEGWYHKQFDRFIWYNNGKFNIRVSKWDIEHNMIPDGFYKGRNFHLPSKKFEDNAK